MDQVKRDIGFVIIVNAMGFKGAERFFTKPQPGEPPPPNPEMAKVQAQTQADMAKLQADNKEKQKKRRQMVEAGRVGGKGRKSTGDRHSK